MPVRVAPTLPALADVIDRVAPWVPPAVGLKRTLTMQLAAAARLAPAQVSAVVADWVAVVAGRGAGSAPAAPPPGVVAGEGVVAPAGGGRGGAEGGGGGA